MPVAALLASHTPLKDYAAPDPAIVSEVDRHLAELRAWVADYAPERVVVVGPDHFNGFFYRLMPSFCVGAAAQSVGDWNTPAGALPVESAFAEHCAARAHADGVDLALSWQMDVDHGVTQILTQLFAWEAVPPLVPVFVNCAAPPLPPIERVVALGRVLGGCVAANPARTLLIASGGLSHDPPIPRLADAPEAVRRRLVEGGRLDAEARAARQQRVLDDAIGQVSGESPRTPLNPAWDEAFLERLVAGDYAAIGAQDDASITRDAGCGGHEIRAWVAVAAAAAAAGIARLERLYYRAIPEWVAGYGLMRGGPAG